MTRIYNPGLGYDTLDLMVDIDDVVFPLIDSIHNLALEHGLHDGTEPMRQWEGWLQYGCPPERYWALWDEFTETGGYQYTPPIPGRAEALRHLHFTGHRIHLVTARGFMSHSDRIRTWTPEWVERFAIPHVSLTFAKDKVGAQIDLGVTFDAAVDDAVKNYEAMVAAGIPTWLMNHAHNEGHPTINRVPDLWTWARQVQEMVGQA